MLDLAKKDDIWLHLKDAPSAHVIIKTNKSKVPEDVLEMAAKFCVEFSVKGAGRYEVDYTKRENLRRENGANVHLHKLQNDHHKQRLKMAVTPFRNSNFINQNAPVVIAGAMQTSKHALTCKH